MEVVIGYENIAGVITTTDPSDVWIACGMIKTSRYMVDINEREYSAMPRGPKGKI